MKNIDMFAFERKTSIVVHPSTVRRPTQKGPLMNKPVITFAHLGKNITNISTATVTSNRHGDNIYDENNTCEGVKAYAASAVIMALNKLSCVDRRLWHTTSDESVLFNAHISALLHDVAGKDRVMCKSESKEHCSCQQSKDGYKSHISDVRIALYNILLTIYNVH